jgi:hypothetical protein
MGQRNFPTVSSSCRMHPAAHTSVLPSYGCPARRVGGGTWRCDMSKQSEEEEDGAGRRSEEEREGWHPMFPGRSELVTRWFVPISTPHPSTPPG